MKYVVTLELYATAEVEAEAESPEEAMKKASFCDANLDSLTVRECEVIGCEDANGNCYRK